MRDPAAAPLLQPEGETRKQVSKMTNRAITNWWIGGLTAMIPSGSCAVLLATHPQGVSDGYGRIMVGFIVVGVVGGLRRIPVAALAQFMARRRGATWREGSRVAENEGRRAHK